MTTEELLIALDSVPFKFWVCKDHRKGMVIWDGDLAICQVCGANSKRIKEIKGNA